MSWTYSGNPSSTPKDAVRFLVGDTNGADPRNQLLTDEEIKYFLNQYNNSPLNASIRCCETISAKFARMSDETVGQVKILYSQKAKAYREMRADLIKRLATEDATPYAGGISVADKITNNMNSDLVQPEFRKHMMENQQISPWVTNSYMDWLWFWA